MDLVKIKEMVPLFEAYRSETDRGAAILAASLLDKLLERLIRKAMLSCATDSFFQGYGPLASFSAKIDLARFFGLISASEHLELHRIRKIRNDFAHSLDHTLSFESQPACDHVKQLKLPHSTLFSGEDISTLRKQFTLSFGAMASLISGEIRQAKSPSEPVDLIVELSGRDESPSRDS